MIVNFKFDKEKDLFNIWRSCNYGKNYGYDFTKKVSKSTLKICENKEYEKVKKDLQKNRESIYKNPLKNILIKSVTESWGKIEKEYFRRLKKITKKEFPFKKINSFMTTAPMCPYSPNKKIPYFYFQIFAGLPTILHTAGHELMHIHLHNNGWWEKVEKTLGNKKTHDLKEALTELLNLEFHDLWIVEDKSYPNHIKLREYIKKQWKKEKDFEKLTNNCIKWIKRNGVK